MKTIFITSFHVLISRNILGTAVLDELLSAGPVRVVVLVPDYKRQYFEQAFGRPNLIFAGVDTGPRIRSRIAGIFRRLSAAMPNTRRAALGRRVRFYGEKPLFIQFLFYAPAGLLGRWRALVKLVRYLDYLLTPRGRFYSLFEQYRPDLIFATDVLNEHDVAVIQDARRKGIRITGMVRSWDNLTARMMRVLPDFLMVHNEIIKREAEEIDGMNPKCIRVVGIPHYDRYINSLPMDREKFLTSSGLDPAKKLIVYAPVCNYRLPRNIVDRHILEVLAGLPANIIVRFPPSAEVSVDGFIPPPHMVFDRPGQGFQEDAIGDRELTPEDDRRLYNMLHWCDLVVSGPSTIIIDAAVFDKPVILVDFYPREIKPAERIYEYAVEHLAPILASGGVRRAQSRDEFLRWIDNYLKDPSLDRAGRKKLIKEQCWKLDGQSSSRIVECLREHLF